MKLVEYDSVQAGLRVAQLRERRGWTQEVLAQKADLSRNYIVTFEQGSQQKAQKRTLKALAAALGWSDFNAMMASDEFDPPPRNGESTPVDNKDKGVSFPGATAVPSNGSDAVQPRGILEGRSYPVYYWGMVVDTRRPDDAPPASYFRHPLATEESLRVGDDGFGLKVEDDSLTLWECAENEPVRHGSVVWCNPDHVDGIQDGDLVVVRDPARGLVAGVYRMDAAEEDGALFLETADATASMQQRRHIKRSWIVGPVVYCTRGGIPRLVERQGRGDSGTPEPTGPSFVGTRSAQG